MSAPPPAVRVIHADDALVVIDKPSGLAVHRGWAVDEVYAVDLVRAIAGPTASPVHRIDRGTSGVMIFALDGPTAAALQAQIEESGGAEKRYVALVRGTPRDGGLVDQPIPRREDGPRVPARTRFRRLATGALPVGAPPESEAFDHRCALVEAWPETGRLHQVRRHLKHAGHPLIGDANYGKGSLNRAYAARVGLARLALHAASIAINHPRSGERMRFEAPLPADLVEPLGRLGILGVG